MPVLYVQWCVHYTVQISGQKGMESRSGVIDLKPGTSISVLSGWVLLGQTLTAREGIGCVLMFVAIILAQIPAKNTERKCIDNCVEI